MAESNITHVGIYSILGGRGVFTLQLSSNSIYFLPISGLASAKYSQSEVVKSKKKNKKSHASEIIANSSS